MVFKTEFIFVRLLAPLLFGIFLAHYFRQVNLLLISLFLSAVFFIALIFINHQYLNFKAYNYKALTGLIINLYCLLFSICIYLLNAQHLRSSYFTNKKSQYLKVWVSSEPRQANNLIRFEAEITKSYYLTQSDVVSGKLSISLQIDQKSPLQINYGDELIIPSNFTPIDPPFNPGEFDFKSYLAAKNIAYQSYLLQHQVFKTHKNQGNQIIKYALSVRKKQVNTYRRLIHNDEAFAVASTLILGYRSDLSKETLAAYSKTGTIHALSVSGMHVGIIYLFLNWVLRFLDAHQFTRMIKLIFISTLIWYYALLTGFSPSVLRSVIMLNVFILAKTFHQTSNNYNILAFTAFVMLVYHPFLIWDVGFQLSFLAVFGLIYLQPKINNWFNFENRWLSNLWSTIALSIAAQITTFPLSIFYFHQFPLYFIFSNLFILLPLTLMMYLGIGILMLKLYFLSPLFESLIIFTNKGLKWIADLPFSGITGIWLHPFQLLLLSLALSILLLSMVKSNKKLLLAAIYLFIVFQGLSTYLKLKSLNQQKIIFFSLRKNYAAAFISSKRAILLTDLKVGDAAFEFSVKPALDQLNVDELSFVQWNEEIQQGDFIQSNHQLRFHQFKILLLDKEFDHQQIKDHPKFDLVWIHQNPKKQLEELRTEVVFNSLLIDATNFPVLIDNYENDAEKFQIQHHTLKKNKAYLIDINQ